MLGQAADVKILGCKSALRGTETATTESAQRTTRQTLWRFLHSRESAALFTYMLGQQGRLGGRLRDRRRLLHRLGPLRRRVVVVRPAGPPSA